MALAIDGSAVHGSYSSGTSFTVTGLTTSNAGDVIVACISVQGGSFSTVSSLSTPGVSWESSARKQQSWNGTSGSDNIQVWYGTASAALSSVTTTINLSAGPSSDTGAIIFAISGANTSSITDANSSLAAGGSGGSSAPSISGISTSNANDIIIAVSSEFPNVTETAGSGYTLLLTTTFAASSLAVMYKIVSATQSSATASFGVSATLWGMIVDAIQAQIPWMPAPNPWKRGYLRR